MNPTKRNTKITRILAMMILTALLATGSLNAIAETVLATEKAKVYQLPSTSSASVTVPAGTIMEKTAEQNGWIRVERDGITAYMDADDVTKVTDCNEATGYLSEDAPMYKAYGKSDKYGTLPKGTKVTVYAVAGKWAYIRCEGYKGFVRKDALTTRKPETSQTTTPEETEKVLRSAATLANISVFEHAHYKRSARCHSI